MLSKKKNKTKKYNPLVAHEKMLKMMPDIIEEKKRRTENLQFRHDLIQTQNRNNYVNEYNRLSGYMNSHMIPTLQPAVKEKINNRLKELSSDVKKSFVQPTGTLYDRTTYKNMYGKNNIIHLSINGYNWIKYT